ncbi:hypothetical protein ACN08X_01310 [Rothia sp. P6271]|uniref:hypothetical protein n=1 Tax=Rothia sp. P6271 TaxID=3402659 RepID=UPI003ACCB543
MRKKFSSAKFSAENKKIQKTFFSITPSQKHYFSGEEFFWKVFYFFASRFAVLPLLISDGVKTVESAKNDVRIAAGTEPVRTGGYESIQSGIT